MAFVAGAIIGGALISGYMSNKAAGEASGASSAATAQSIAEQRRQYDLTRKDQQPFLEAGQQATNYLMGGAQQGSGLDPRLQYQNMPGNFAQRDPYDQFNADPNAPQYQGSERFKFDLESDPGYNFARDEALKAVNRNAAGTGNFLSGNRLAELSDRATGVASQYANDAYNRQFGESSENYNRGVGDYNIAADADRTRYGREADQYQYDVSRNQDLYGRDVDQYNRDVYGSESSYGRAMDEYNRRYGQYTDQMNRYAALAGAGQTAASNLGTAGTASAANIGNLLSSNAAEQAQASYDKYSGLNNATQAGVQNWLTYKGVK